jgi:DNA-binding response OmpR family regulator
MRVLVVEDDRSMAASLAKGLGAEGYIVDVVHDGEQGLSAALLDDFDVILLDIMLPKLNGYAVLASLREHGCESPVLMLTAKTGEWDQAEALDGGADDFLSKPFAYPVLLARIRALIRRGSGGSGATLTVGDLRMDTAARRCAVGDENIDLTAREFAVLEYLMHRPGVVVSKLDLLHHVWDLALEGETNVVEVYVGYLRRKLAARSARTVIETVRGVGYRIAVDEAGRGA